MAAGEADALAGRLRAEDPERYFATLVLPERERRAAQALFLFSNEIASVRERAHNPNAGEIRLQWWDDALAGGGHGEVRRNPVADALLEAIAQFSLPVAPLQQLIEARCFDLYDDPMPDLPSFEGYAGETVSVLYQLAAMILNGGRPVVAGDAAGHLGVAQAMLGHLSAFGFYAAQGRLFLPLSIFVANGVTEAEIFSGQGSEGLHEARAQLLEIARGHLDKAEAAVEALPRDVRRAFAVLPVLRLRMKALERAGGSPFAPAPEIADWRKIAAMSFWAWRRA